jgi:hypothetical protein
MERCGSGCPRIVRPSRDSPDRPGLGTKPSAASAAVPARSSASAIATTAREACPAARLPADAVEIVSGARSPIAVRTAEPHGVAGAPDRELAWRAGLPNRRIGRRSNRAAGSHWIARLPFRIERYALQPWGDCPAWEASPQPCCRLAAKPLWGYLAPQEVEQMATINSLVTRDLDVSGAGC